MTKIPIQLELITTVSEFEKMMLQSIRDIFNVALPKVAPEVQKDLQRNLTRVFTETRVYDGLINGPLNAHFGFEKGSEDARVDAILFALAKSIRVRPIRVAVRGKRLTGGLRIEMFTGDFRDLLSLSEAVVINRGVSLPWLQWLLKEGDRIIIDDFKIDFNKHPRSRSGEAIMVHDPSRVWRVPVGASGTEKDNWITNAVDKGLGFIEKVASRSIDRHLDRIL
jgi:hypothetical protein